MRIRVPEQNYDHKVIEETNKSYWDKTRTYNNIKKDKEKGKTFFINDGPPFALDTISLGLVRNKIIKDTVIRYKRAKGFNVRDQPCFDMHGVPIEIAVERDLEIGNKKEIVENGVDNFVEACRERAARNYKFMVEFFRSVDIWQDWDNPSLSDDNQFIESAWWALKKAHDKELLNQEKRLVQWCPRCETSLAEAEIVYTTVAGRGVYLKFPIKGRRDEYIVIWTTYPWTILANMAIAVNPNQNYARVTIRKGGKKEVIITLESKIQELVDTTNIDAFEIIETLSGEQLKGLEYFHPMMGEIKFQRNVSGQWVHKIITSERIGTRKTGSVGISPGHGFLDFSLGSEYNLPTFCPIDERGFYTTAVGMKYGGKYIKEVEETIISDLKALRFVLHEHDLTHRKGHCWRCDTQIVHRITKQWFLDVGDVSDKIIRAIGKIDWTPKHAGNELFEKTQQASSWCISRQRYWGIPIPIWECLTDICGHHKIIGSTKELQKAHGYGKNMDLHIPSIDNISLECPKCNGLMKRVPDVLDVWFDSSINSWAQLNYPKDKKEFKKWWPPEWLCEGHEQIKGWFYSQLCTNLLVLGKNPYKSALVHGRSALDPDLSSANEGIPDNEIISNLMDQYGVDALRFSLATGSAPWDNDSLSEYDIEHAARLLRKLWNISYYIAKNIEIKEFDPQSIEMEKVLNKLEIEDRWMLSRLETVSKELERKYESFELHEAASIIESFINQDFSNTYLKIVKKRLKDREAGKSIEPLLKTLHYSLERLAIMIAPICPHISEQIYQSINGKKLSVHLLEWPKANRAFINEGLEGVMKNIREITHAVLKARHYAGHRLRWPLKNLVIEVHDHELHEAIEPFADVLSALTNSKKVELVPEGHEWEGREFEVSTNPKAIGKAYKQWERKIAMMLKMRSAKEIKDKIEKGEYYLGIEGHKVKILPEMVSFTTKLPEHIINEVFSQGEIYLDLEQEDELMSECYTLDIIRRVQDMRKDMALDMEEFIKIQISMGEKLLEWLLEGKWLDTVAEKTNCNQLEIVEDIDDTEFIVEWEIDGEEVVIGIESLHVKTAIDELTRMPGITKDIALALIDVEVNDAESLKSAEREFLLKIPGINHAKIRKIKEYFETPEELRVAREENLCPVCEGEIDTGIPYCERCGVKLTGDDDSIDVEFIGDIVDEDEDELDFQEDEEVIAEAEPEKVVPETGERIVVPEDDGMEYDYISDIEAEDISIEVAAKPLEDGPEQDEALVEGHIDEKKIKDIIITGDKDEIISTFSNLFEINPSVAKSLYEVGYDSIESIKDASENDLKNIKGIGKATARKILRLVSEKQEQMCSLCNAIVEEGSTECPRCSTLFAGASKEGPGVDEDEMPEEALPAEEAPVVEEVKIEEPEPEVDDIKEVEEETPEEPVEPEVPEEIPEEPIGEEDVVAEAEEEAKTLHSEAMELRQSGYTEEALASINKALETHPENGLLLREKEDLEVEIELMSDYDTKISGEDAAIIIDVDETTDEDDFPALIADAIDVYLEKLKDSYTYLIPEERSYLSYRYLCNELKHGRPGFCVTRSFPDKIKSKFDLGDTPILWLSNVGKDNAIRPKDLEKLSLSFEQFLSSKGGIILLDGIEYLITNNKFITVLRLIQSLRDQVAINKSILLISVNPSTLEKSELNLLEREVDLVIKN
ncbi:MAG: isoleucine--tRNA ligase [Thermoplasmata archaeon]|nr:isoleucine--tRNA ligase [Thermoplasmata archaeon]